MPGIQRAGSASLSTYSSRHQHAFRKPYDVFSPEDEASPSEILRLPSLDVELDLDESEGGHTPSTGTCLDDSPMNFGRGFVRGIWTVGTTL